MMMGKRVVIRVEGKQARIRSPIRRIWVKDNTKGMIFGTFWVGTASNEYAVSNPRSPISASASTENSASVEQITKSVNVHVAMAQFFLL